SNLFNILLVLGMSAVITPIPFDTSLNIEVGILVASTLLVLLFIKIDLGKTNRAISSLEGIILVLLYLFFLLRPIFF
ncbi:MAG: sodium:calcium antiporter, partial [bacterium]